MKNWCAKLLFFLCPTFALFSFRLVSSPPSLFTQLYALSYLLTLCPQPPKYLRASSFECDFLRSVRNGLNRIETKSKKQRFIGTVCETRCWQLCKKLFYPKTVRDGTAPSLFLFVINAPRAPSTCILNLNVTSNRKPNGRKKGEHVYVYVYVVCEAYRAKRKCKKNIAEERKGIQRTAYASTRYTTSTQARSDFRHTYVINKHHLICGRRWCRNKREKVIMMLAGIKYALY